MSQSGSALIDHEGERWRVLWRRSLVRNGWDVAVVNRWGYYAEGFLDSSQYVPQESEAEIMGIARGLVSVAQKRARIALERYEMGKTGQLKKHPDADRDRIIYNASAEKAKRDLEKAVWDQSGFGDKPTRFEDLPQSLPWRRIEDAPSKSEIQNFAPGCLFVWKNGTWSTGNWGQGGQYVVGLFGGLLKIQANLEKNFVAWCPPIWNVMEAQSDDDTTSASTDPSDN